MRNNKGFTLIELLIVISIGSILITASFGIFRVGRASHSTVVEEFDKQFAIRHSADVINENIKFATVGFVVTEENYKPEDGLENGLVEPWNYIGLNGSKDALVHYKWVEDPDDPTTGEYKTEVLAEPSEGVTLDIMFHKSAKHPESNLLKYHLKGFKDGDELFDFETEVEALNALQVIDWGNVKDRAVALAYRNEETPEIDEVEIGALSLVIDESGSMDWTMDGYWTNSDDVNVEDPRRMALLKHTLNKDGGLFTILSDSEAYTSIIPFDWNANNPGNFYKVKDNVQSLKNEISALDPGGSTNTGDGVRRGYFNLVNFNDFPPSDIAHRKINNYLVLLVDGETNRFSYYDNNNNREYLLSDGNTISTSGSWSRGPEYIKVLKDSFDNDNLINFKKIFVIGYSKDSGDIKQLAEDLDIVVSNEDEAENFINNDQVFIATDQDSLTKAFEDIGNYIKEDLWQVSGPKL